MSEQLRNFTKRVEEIQAKCACPSHDAQECIRIRYGVLPHEEFSSFEEDTHCQCICHEEIAEEEDSQEWPL